MKYNRDNLPQFLFCGAISNYSENRVDEHSNKWSTLNFKETPPLLLQKSAGIVNRVVLTSTLKK